MTTSDRAGWIALGLVAAAAVVIGLLVQSGAIATGTGQSDEEREIGACLAVQSHVRDQLVSPATADFERCGVVSVVKLSEAEYRVSGHVDSENRVGGKLRTNYAAIARSTGPNQWAVRLEQLDTR